MFIEFFKRFLPGVQSFHDMVQGRKNYIDALRKTTPSLLRKYLFDFTTGCSKPDSSLKEHLMQLLIHREHNGFKIPDNVKVVIYDNILEGKEYERINFDVALMDKCFVCKIEE